MAGPRGFEPRTSVPVLGWFYSFFRVFLRGFGDEFRFVCGACRSIQPELRAQGWNEAAKVKGLRRSDSKKFKEPKGFPLSLCGDTRARSKGQDHQAWWGHT